VSITTSTTGAPAPSVTGWRWQAVALNANAVSNTLHRRRLAVTPAR
jgi:hypothetical protein